MRNAPKISEIYLVCSWQPTCPYLHSGDSRIFWHAAFYSNLLFTTTPVSVGINSGLKLTGVLPGISLGEQ